MTQSKTTAQVYDGQKSTKAAGDGKLMILPPAPGSPNSDITNVSPMSISPCPKEQGSSVMPFPPTSDRTESNNNTSDKMEPQAALSSPSSLTEIVEEVFSSIVDMASSSNSRGSDKNQTSTRRNTKTSFNEPSLPFICVTPDIVEVVHAENPDYPPYISLQEEALITETHTIHTCEEVVTSTYTVLADTTSAVTTASIDNNDGNDEEEVVEVPTISISSSSGQMLLAADVEVFNEIMEEKNQALAAAETNQEDEEEEVDEVEEEDVTPPSNPSSKAVTVEILIHDTDEVGAKDEVDSGIETQDNVSDANIDEKTAQNAEEEEEEDTTPRRKEKSFNNGAAKLKSSSSFGTDNELATIRESEGESSGEQNNSAASEPDAATEGSESPMLSPDVLDVNPVSPINLSESGFDFTCLPPPPDGFISIGEISDNGVLFIDNPLSVLNIETPTSSSAFPVSPNFSLLPPPPSLSPNTNCSNNNSASLYRHNHYFLHNISRRVSV